MYKGSLIFCALLFGIIFIFPSNPCEAQKKPVSRSAKARQRKPARNANIATPKAKTARRAGNTNQTAMPAATNSNPVAIIETDVGIIKIEILKDESPITAENFIQLASRGFYNGLIFHRVISGFMIQGGDPKGNGTGGQTATGDPLPNEINPASPLYQDGYKRGIVAMANKGRPESGSSQFFIMHRDRPRSMLPPNYTIFGRVIEGMDVVDNIADAPNGVLDRPETPVKMIRIIMQ
ncbi:MAG TPA: peptidylprolyl isomerase [Blastocatellia bacterium]|nr:peptidylprolyl isomerase [Blastocatellia bacterium]